MAKSRKGLRYEHNLPRAPPRPRDCHIRGVWQLSLFLAMMAATMAQWGQIALVFSVWTGSSSGLWFCWLRHLGNGPDTARMRGDFAREFGDCFQLSRDGNGRHGEEPPDL